MKVEVTRMELKYCERCGGMLLRRSGSVHIYCPACTQAVAQLAPARTASRGGRKPPMSVKRTIPVRPTIVGAAAEVYCA